ncbi:MAG: GNAT family protein [Nitrolancea sp.]
MSSNVERVIVSIEGERIALGPLRRDLLPDYQRWINSFATQRTVAQVPRPWTMEQEQRWIEGQLTAEKEAPFTIYEKSSMRSIGTTSVAGIDHTNGTAEFGILIGEPDCRGKGYGTETASLMLDYAFTALGLKNVMLRVLAFNLAGLRAYQKAGFKEIGRRREAHLMNDRRYDVVLMDCLASEFKSRNLARIFTPDRPRG